MRVLSLLGPGEHGHLCRAASESWVVRAATLREVLEELATRAGGAVVLDPADIENGVFDELLMRAGRAGARLLLCGEPLEIGAPAIVTAVGTTHVEVLGTAIGESRGDVRALIALNTPSIPMQVLRLVGRNLLRLPHRAASSAVRLFTFASLPDGIDEIRRHVGRHQTTLGDYYREVGICSPNRLLTIARVSHACHYATCGLKGASQVAAACGFKNSRVMSEALKDTLGTTHRALRDNGPRPDVAVHLAGLVIRSPWNS